MITEAQKQKIIAAIAGNRVNYPSDAKHAASLGISTSVYSAIKNGQTDKALSDANWISIARKLGVNLRGEMEWKAAFRRFIPFLQLSRWVQRRIICCMQDYLGTALYVPKRL